MTQSLVNAINALTPIKLMLHIFLDPGCDEGHIRLVDGIINKTGQAEVCMDNVWKSVADDHDWGVEEATLICRELGLPTDGQRYCQI